MEDKHRDSVLTSCLDITAEIQTFWMNYFRRNFSKLVSSVQSKHIGVKVPCSLQVLTHPVWHVISFDSDNRPSSSFLCEVYLNMWIDSYTPQKIMSIGFNKWTILSHVFIVGIRHYMKVMLIGQRFCLRSSQLTRPASLLFHRCFSFF